MGYSIHVPCKSMKARNEMEAFLKEHYHTLSQSIQEREPEVRQNLGALGMTPEEVDWTFKALADAEYDQTGNLWTGRADLYTESDLTIGFSTNANAPQDQTMYSMCCWMALKVGRLRKLKNAVYGYEGKDPMPDIQVPYFLYDDYDVMPVIRDTINLGGIGPEARNYLETCRIVDESGFRPAFGFSRKATSVIYGDSRFDVSSVTDVILHDELKRLEGLWKARGTKP